MTAWNQIGKISNKLTSPRIFDLFFIVTVCFIRPLYILPVKDRLFLRTFQWWLWVPCVICFLSLVAASRMNQEKDGYSKNRVWWFGFFNILCPKCMLSHTLRWQLLPPRSRREEFFWSFHVWWLLPIIQIRKHTRNCDSCQHLRKLSIIGDNYASGNRLSQMFRSSCCRPVGKVSFFVVCCSDFWHPSRELGHKIEGKWDWMEVATICHGDGKVFQ